MFGSTEIYIITVCGDLSIIIRQDPLSFWLDRNSRASPADMSVPDWLTDWWSHTIGPSKTAKYPRRHFAQTGSKQQWLRFWARPKAVVNLTVGLLISHFTKFQFLLRRESNHLDFCYAASLSKQKFSAHFLGAWSPHVFWGFLVLFFL